MRAILIISFFVCFSCTTSKNFIKSRRQSTHINGTEFYKKAFAFNWQQRDSFAVEELLAGNMPDFIKNFIPVTVILNDSLSGKILKATYYVSPDYLSIGSNNDWARIPLTPMAAQKIANAYDCFLPTRKMVDDIYKASRLKLEPVPLYVFRDSTPTMYHHHLIIEGQRKGRTGLIAGIKKDVVIADKINRDAKPNRVAIYGWHKPDGKPIQPLYTGHVNWYVDYSHGIRLIFRKIKVGNVWKDYVEVLKDPVLKKLICDEQYCDFYSYTY